MELSRVMGRSFLSPFEMCEFPALARDEYDGVGSMAIEKSAKNDQCAMGGVRWGILQYI